jgi:hypothetical protein
MATDYHRCEQVMVTQMAVPKNQPLTDGHWQSMRLQGHICALAFRDQAGSRAVQHALEIAPTSLKIILVDELRDHVTNLIDSPHGNYVIQKAIRVLPAYATDFIIKEVAACPLWLPYHKLGCSVFQ